MSLNVLIVEGNNPKDSEVFIRAAKATCSENLKNVVLKLEPSSKVKIINPINDDETTQVLENMDEYNGIIFTGGAISNTQRTTGVDVAGMLRTFGIDNPFGRKQETEADYLGLIFSSLAGYDIREAPKVWERMKEAYKGKEPPEFMSTHPSSTNRIKNLNGWINEIILKYPPIA